MSNNPTLELTVVVAAVLLVLSFAFGDYRFYLVHRGQDAERPMYLRLPTDDNLNGREMACEARVQRLADAPRAGNNEFFCEPVAFPVHLFNLARRAVADSSK